jgi:hypothetical protein
MIVRPKLMIIGHARHGKDTVASILTETFGLKALSSSHYAGQKVMMPFFASKGINYSSWEECYVDRGNHRQDWHEQIALYNTPDKAKLPREIYQLSDIYVGIRCDEEFKAAKAEGLFDFSIWVDRSKHLPPEPYESNKLNYKMADHIIDNNGTLQQLKMRTIYMYWNLVSLSTIAVYDDDYKKWESTRKQETK